MKISSLYNVMTKEALINLRVRAEVRDEFKIAADLRGASMSGLLHQFIYRTIREEKERCPDRFENIQIPNVDNAQTVDNTQTNAASQPEPPERRKIATLKSRGDLPRSGVARMIQAQEKTSEEDRKKDKKTG